MYALHDCHSKFVTSFPIVAVNHTRENESVNRAGSHTPPFLANQKSGHGTRVLPASKAQIWTRTSVDFSRVSRIANFLSMHEREGAWASKGPTLANGVRQIMMSARHVSVLLR